MSELLKKQNYGVEVEFTGISRKMAADAVAEIIGTTASRPDHTCYQTTAIPLFKRAISERIASTSSTLCVSTPF